MLARRPRSTHARSIPPARASMSSYAYIFRLVRLDTAAVLHGVAVGQYGRVEASLSVSSNESHQYLAVFHAISLSHCGTAAVAQ